MAKIYVVEYHYELFGEKHEEERHILGVFDNYENGLAYLRKFYEGDKRDTRDFYNESLSQTEYKTGEHTAKASRRYKEDKQTQVETLNLYPMSINNPSDPYNDIMEVWA
mgnify:CR=1 FL=1